MIQAQFINYLLDSKDTSIITLNNLTEDYFSDYRDEFNYIRNHIIKYGNIPDKETFLSIFTSFEVITVKESPKYLLDALFEDRNKRILAETFNGVRDVLLNGETDKAVSLYLSASKKIASAKYIDAVDIYKDVSRYDSYVDRINNFNKYYVKTGFNELDDVLGGWDRKEECALIIARPGLGKTWILLKVASAAAMQGLRVGIYEGEVSVDKTGRRIDTLISHISNGSLNHGDESVQVEYKKFLEASQKTMQDKIYVLTPDKLGGPATVGVLRAFIDKYNLDMLCIDQHSLLEDERNGKSNTERAANISTDIHTLQVMTKIPIIAISQQNRESTKDEGVSTSNVAQSDKLGQDATVVIALERKDKTLTLNIIKARDGGDGNKLTYAADFNRGIFTYLPSEHDALGGANCDELKDEYEGDANDVHIRAKQMTYVDEDDSPF